MQTHYDAGLEYVKAMQKTWQTLDGRIDPEIFSHVRAKLKTQLEDAATWHDTCLAHFATFTD